MDQLDRSEQNQDRYLARADQLQKRAAREIGLPPGLLPAPLTLVQWLVKLRPTLRPASWRQYRAAIFASLEHLRTEEAGLAMLELLQADSGPCLRRPTRPRTGGQKMRRLPQADLETLLAHFEAHPSLWSAGTALWLQAGRTTGLRPCEWPSAQLFHKGGEHILVIRNAKNSNGRSHGEFRHLQLGLLDAEALRILQAMLEWVEHVQADASWRAAYEGCRKALHRACRRLWTRRKRYPSLYSGRHQFAADGKARGLTPAQLAALMGHAVSDTAAEHYGQGRYGQGGFVIQPDSEEVARVIDRPVGRAEKLRNGARLRP